MGNQANALRYAVRFRVVLKYFGQLCLVLAALTLVPLVMSLIFGDTHISLRYGLVIGGLVAFLDQPQPIRKFRRPGVLSPCRGWSSTQPRSTVRRG